MTLTLTANINATTRRLRVTGSVAGIQPGYAFRLDDELLTLQGFISDGGRYQDPTGWYVNRGVDSTAASHTAGADILGAVDAFASSDSGPTPPNPWAGGGGGQTADVQAALDGANAPDGGNVFATIADVGAGSAGWDLHTLSALEADWTPNGATGTWTFVDGVISHTVADEDAVITYSETIPGIEYIVEADIRIPTGQDVATTVKALVAAGQPNPASGGSDFLHVDDIVGEGVYLLADAPGDGANIFAPQLLDGPQAAPLWPTGIAQGDWHTLRQDIGAARQIISLDGTVLYSIETISGGNNADPSTTPPTTVDSVMIGAVGLADFRNVKVWTRALPA